MKIIRNDMCYIESEDIEFVDGRLLSGVSTVYSSVFDFEKYETEEMVAHFKESECILDYDFVQYLSEEALDLKIREFTQKVEALEKGVKQDSDFASLKYILQSLKKYKENRSLYDREIRSLSFAKKFKRVPLNYMSAVPQTPPVTTIPVGAEALFELDQSIIDKCKQNNGKVNENDRINVYAKSKR